MGTDTDEPTRLDLDGADGEFDLFCDVCAALSTADTVDAGLELVLSKLYEITPWAYGEVWALDDDRQHLEHVSTCARPDGDVAAFTDRSKSMAFERGSGLPGRVWDTGESEWIEDVSACTPENYHRTDAASDAGFQTAFGVPIVARDRVEAVLVYYLRDRRAIDGRLRSILETVANNLGNLVARKRVEQSLRRERNLLEQLLETSPIGIAVITAGGRITRSNERAATLYGRPGTDSLTGPVDDLGLPLCDRDGEALSIAELPIWDVFETREPVFGFEHGIDRADGSRRWVSLNAAPIVDDGRVSRVIVAIENITDRIEREQRLRSQRDTLERVQRIIDALRPVSELITQATTRTDIDQPVCRRLIASDIYTVAWIDEFVSTDQPLSVRGAAGIESASIESGRSHDGEDGSDQPVAPLQCQAIRTREVCVTRRDRGDETEFPTAVVDSSIRAVGAVPIVSNDTCYGTLVVCSRRAEAFDDPEQGLLAELGKQLGHAITAAANRQLVYSESVVELDFRVTDAAAPLVAVTDGVDCEIRIDEIVPVDGGICCYLRVDGVHAGRVADELERTDAVENVRVVRDRADDGTQLECHLDERSPVYTLVEHNAGIRSARVHDGVAHIRAQVPPTTDVRAIVTRLQEAYPETELRSKQIRGRSAKRVAEFVETVDQRLTDRQREVLATAYQAGYYEWPRDSTGEELAAALSVSPATINEHLRKGVRTLLEPLFDADSSAE